MRGREAEIDLGASALIFAEHQLVAAAFYGQLTSKDGAVRHQGDNLTGEGEGDDEVIAVNLTRLPAHVTAVVFVVTSYAGHTFERVRNAFWRLVDDATNTELARAKLRVGGAHTGMVVAKVRRAEGVWQFPSARRTHPSRTPGRSRHPTGPIPLTATTVRDGCGVGPLPLGFGQAADSTRQCAAWARTSAADPELSCRFRRQGQHNRSTRPAAETGNPVTPQPIRRVVYLPSGWPTTTRAMVQSAAMAFWASVKATLPEHTSACNVFSTASFGLFGPAPGL